MPNVNPNDFSYGADAEKAANEVPFVNASAPEVNASASEEPLSFGSSYQMVRDAFDSVQRSMHLLNVDMSNLHREKESLEKAIAIRSEELNRLASLARSLQEIKESVEGVPVEAKLPEGIMPSFHNFEQYR